MHLPRKLSRLLLAAALPLSFAACAPESGDEQLDEFEIPPAEEPAPAEPAPPEPATPAAPTTAQFTSLNDSGVMGSVEIQDQGDQTTVVSSLTGGQAGTEYQGMVHSGTCDAPGDVVEQLSPVTVAEDGSGESSSTVAMAPAMVMDGQHIVLYHGADNAPVACAAIPAQTTM
ncbi:MAG: hypothetical protein ACREM1_10905 [Longimicrobiales bacterium]